MIEYILWWLLAVIWFGCGIWARGVMLKYWLDKYPYLIREEVLGDWPLSLIALGPMELYAARLTAGHFKTKF